ncbi:MAG: hypothetical protein HOA08_12945 [Rhodospirillaceae bacterium]|jgi:hypothetical protein|nr:hypothetical protein [Rhodospirillaceae bacterium]MBT3491764.1 hypothetical protein [Rhodospirillaceae bacterium]MBT3783180.1 hypothetical protein [Rhodospirillaceae bacterium]MBT3978176.1 hypothetical protein [Rhodospirillaceae bacterium]MBT4168202.1 hypothetical protein [Rhodospirillaceae bacterium]
MKFVCDAGNGKTWFRMETEVEADQESALMQHAVAKHFRLAKDKATASYKPTSTVYIEQNIGLEAHLQRQMPLFLTLRDRDGTGLATAMLPPAGNEIPGFRTIVVGPDNSDPYKDQSEAIQVLGQNFGLALERADCFPYRQT